MYVGLTSKHPDEKVKEHNSGKSAWSKQNRPLKLIYYESYFCRKDAQLRERFYKSGFGRRIKKLIIAAIL